MTVVRDGNGSVKATSNHSKEEGYGFIGKKNWKCSLAVHFQSYPLALVEKEQPKIFKMADSSASSSSRPSCSTEHEDESTDTGSSESVVPAHSLSPECEETQESTGIGTATNQGKSDVWLYFSKGPTSPDECFVYFV